MILGYVLSGSTTHHVRAQLTEEGESHIVEGMLLVVEGKRCGKLLCRVDTITYIDELYEERTPFAEIVKRGIEMRGFSSLRYAVAELSVLGRIDRGRLEDARLPPEPGDKLKFLSNELESLFSQPNIVPFGTIVGYESLPLPLDLEALTMHLGIFGETGSGKSYTVGYLIEKLSNIEVDGVRVAMPILVIDANGDYVDFHETFISRGFLGAYRKVLRFVFPHARSIAMTKPFTRIITVDLDVLTPRELAEFIVAYRVGVPELNELQVSLIERFLRYAIEYLSTSFTELLTRNVNEIEKLFLEFAKEQSFHQQTVRAALAALTKFVDDLVHRYRIVSRDPTLSTRFIDEITENPSLAILDFSVEGAPGVPTLVKQFVVGYVAKLLYTKFTEYKVNGRERYLLFVVEEAQNYVPNQKLYPVGWSFARDSLALLATQGRKFGVCLALVSQRPRFVDPIVVSMLNTWIIHRIPPDDAEYISKLAGGLPRALEHRLTKLRRGVALVVGQMNALGIPILVAIPRREVPHRVGETNLIKSLVKVGTQSS